MKKPTDYQKSMASRKESHKLGLIEFSNILATYWRTGSLSSKQVESLLHEVETRMHNLIAIPHITALRIAQRFEVSAYDARFLAVAERFGAKLVTEDTKLRAAKPMLTQSLSDI